MPTVTITGGTGLVGTALTKMLVAKGYEVIILSRNTSGEKITFPNVNYAIWDIEKQVIDENAINKADYIVHLAGAGVAEKRWSTKRKNEIVESRTQSAALIVKSLKEIPNQIKAIISASAIGWYGADTPETISKPFTETKPADNEFLGETCRLWEESIAPVTSMHKRLVIFRTGIVLDANGGALKEFLKPLRSGIAAILGSGKQIISWIHIDDMCRLYMDAIENERLQGVYNAVAPKPVTNRTLVLELAKQLKGKYFIPVHVPAFVLKIMLGEMSIEVLKSANVSAEKISKTGFQFLYPSIESALNNLVKMKL
ncbi:MAG: TIGR01777 family oxidoreductase [Bacteroidetes bacterium]|nr:TIGR01777 family oxidoreductase [Bacteroidota bacterium]